MKINAVLLAAAAATGTLAASPAQAEWVASWAASPVPPGDNAATYDNVTLSQIVRISEGGTQLRVRLTNRYGDRPLVIGAARVVQIDADGAEVPGTSRALTFGGETDAVIPRGALFVTDAVSVDLPDLARLKIEFYLPQATGACTCHPVGLDQLAVSAPGNHVGEAWEPASTGGHRAFLSTVEVDSPDALGTIVAYGDSITDGVGATFGADRRWPDILANRLQAGGKEWAIANAAISGNRVLSFGAGESALSRFDEDVLSLPNVRYMIVFEGVNDIGVRYGRRRNEPPAATDLPEIDVDQMIAGYKQLIARAHAKGIKVIGSPIGPYKGAGYWSEDGEKARMAINDWILNGGAFDAITRLDVAFAEPGDPATMREGYHMGDYLHGNDAGLKAVAESIDLSLFDGD